MNRPFCYISRPAGRKCGQYVQLLFLFLLLASFSFAQSLSVEKLVEKSGISAGGSVQVLLKFSNPFGQEIPIKVVDRNVIGGNGVDIQCLEYLIPADKSTVVGYEPIQAFQSGSFTLEKAKITYTNPASGKEETVGSTSPEVRVNPSPGMQATQESVTTIYSCGGTNVRSTSMSSSTQAPSSQQQAQQNQQTQGRLQEMQQQNMQDMNSVKQQMEQQQKQENELKNKIENDPDFKKMQDELQKQGYSLQKSQINPEQNSQSQNHNPQSQQNSQSPQQSQNPQNPPAQSQNQNPSASFKYDFQKPTGENATIQGMMDNGSMQELSKWSAEDEQALAQKIEQDPKFQQLARSLSQQGFNQTGKKISPPSANLSQFTYSFSNLNETRNITGTATPQGNITSIKIEQPNKKSDFLFWLSLLLLLLLAYSIYPKKPAPEVPQPQAHLNPRKEALAMISRAEQLFASRQVKDAFALLSEAVRFYFRHKSGIGKKELATSDVLKYLRAHERRLLKPATECLSLCGLVSFAKFSPLERDFRRAAALARKLVQAH